MLTQALVRSKVTDSGALPLYRFGPSAALAPDLHFLGPDSFATLAFCWCWCVRVSQITTRSSSVLLKSVITEGSLISLLLCTEESFEVSISFTYMVSLIGPTVTNHVSCSLLR